MIMSTRWSEEKIWKWYNSRPWIRGCNYMSADCANRIDQWQEFEFEKRLETTEKELALMADVKAVILDEDWFQVYDNNNKFTEKYVASGLYWNYFYHTWKTVSWSPYANAIVFVDDGATVTAPATVAFKVQSVVNTGTNLIVTLAQVETDSVANSNLVFVQDAQTTEDGVAVHPYGAIIAPITATTADNVTTYSIPDVELIGKIGTVGYTATADIDIDVAVGDTVTMAKDA